MDHYSQLLTLLETEQRRRDRRRPAPASNRHSLDALPPLSKAMDSFTREMTKLTPRSAKPAPRPTPRQALGEFMAKANAAFASGRITADQLCTLEARRHHVVNAMAQRGAL